MPLRIAGATSGYVELIANAVGSNNTLTVPTVASGLLVAASSTGTDAIPTGYKIAGASSGSIFAPGMLLQRAVTVFTSEVQFTSTSYATVFTASSFTPLSANSRIYISANIHHGKRATGEHQYSSRVQRNGVTVTQNLSSEDGSVRFDVIRINTADYHGFSKFFYYDEPGSTSPITYTWQAGMPNAGYPTIYFNFGGNTGRSHIIIEEIAR